MTPFATIPASSCVKCRCSKPGLIQGLHNTSRSIERWPPLSCVCGAMMAFLSILGVDHRFEQVLESRLGISAQARMDLGGLHNRARRGHEQRKTLARCHVPQLLS